MRRNLHLLLDKVRAEAGALSDVTEEFPWGERVFKVRGRIFLMVGENSDHLALTMKFTSEEREDALYLPFMEVARYVGRFGWLTARIRRAAEWHLVVPWLRESYRLRASARDRGRR